MLGEILKSVVYIPNNFITLQLYSVDKGGKSSDHISTFNIGNNILIINYIIHSEITFQTIDILTNCYFK